MRKLPVLFFIQLITLISFAQKTITYNNPILAGFYPDPSICQAGDDYYVVNSSFAYFPGLPVFHSTDLVNWQQVGNAMDRPEQLNLDRAGVSRGLFAPAISYHNGLFYIVCTLIDKGGNFVITAKDPKGPWSNPVWLKEVDGIDPSLFFDNNDKAYIIYNSVPPGNKVLYDGHRTIRMYELDAAQLKIKGEEKLLVNGGTDISKKPVWIEGPHIYHINDWYYLMCAEGGTASQHSEVVFRSRQAEGPYIAYEKNPILTQRHLDPKRKDPVTTTGHADMVQTKEGKWFAVFLGCRPYNEGYYNIGRETFMLPVHWENDWPVILKDSEEVSYHPAVPFSATKKVNNPFSGNVIYKDDFKTSSLNYRWLFLRTPKEQWYSLKEKKGFITMNLQPETAGGRGNPSFLAFRQQNVTCTAVTTLRFDAANENEKAGLAVFQNETHFYYACCSRRGDKRIVQLYKATKDSAMELITEQVLFTNENIADLKITISKDACSFYYATGDKDWRLLSENEDARFLSTKIAGGFVGSVFALYATSHQQQSNSKVYFDSFEYRGDDALYKINPQ